MGLVNGCYRMLDAFLETVNWSFFSQFSWSDFLKFDAFYPFFKCISQESFLFFLNLFEFFFADIFPQKSFSDCSLTLEEGNVSNPKTLN